MTAQVVISATFTAEPIQESLAFWLHTLDMPDRIRFAPYHQLFQQLLDPASLSRQNRAGINLLLVRLDDWLAGDQPLDLEVSPIEKERLLAGQARYTLPDGLEIAHLNAYETAYLYREIFTERAYLRHGINLPDQPYVVDVGANIGLFSLFIRRQFPQARLYAFEPAPPAFEALRINAALYGGQQIKLFDCGLSDAETTEADFVFYRRSSVFSGYYADAAQDERSVRAVIRNMLQAEVDDPVLLERLADELVADRLAPQSYRCRLRSLSDIIRAERLPRIDLLKIDAEKSELDILRGIKAEDWPRIRQIVLERHGDPAPVVDILRRQGFTVHMEEEPLLREAGLYTLYAIRPDQASDSALPPSNSLRWLPPSNSPRWGEDRPASPPAGGIEGGQIPQAENTAPALDRLAADLAAALREAAAHTAVPYLLCFCPSAAASARAGRLAERLTEELAGVGGLYIIDPLRRYPLPPDQIHDPYGDRLGHVPYTPAFFAALGTAAARSIYAIRNRSPKVIALDCDNTLWSGVCAEDGPEGVRPDRALQSFMVDQTAAGRLLCLCSKNRPEDVWAVFEQRDEMPLRRDHMVAARINWRPKSENLRALAEELNLGLDSFVFIDDNPLERAEVRANCPQVITLPLSVSWEHLWLFDALRVTDTDRQRTRLYQQNRRREELRRETPTLADFLAGLNLEIRISEMAAVYLPRAAQLTQRTNQFNAAAVRRSAEELERGRRDGAFEALTVAVSDRFGDYGLVGLMLFAADRSALKVDTFLLSCRALGRGVEHTMLARLGQIALERALERVEIRYRPTPRNEPVLNFLSEQGERDGDGFSFPAETAAAARFDPAARPATSPVESTPAAESAPADSRPRTEQLLHIATKLNSLAAIQQAVRDFHRRARPAADFIPPRTPTEIRLAQLWAEILRLDRVGAGDNFLELGGNSLLATRLASRIYRDFGTALSLEALLARPTLNEQAKLLVADGPAAGPDLPPLQPRPRPERLPLSPAQQRLWFLHQLEPDNPAYNITLPIQLTGPLDVAALRRSLAELIRRHESLRTVFPAVDGQPVQRILPAWEPLRLIDETNPSPPHPGRFLRRMRLGMTWEDLLSEETTAYLRAAARRRFDLADGPLFEADLLRLADSETHLLLLNMPHIIIDEWSLRILFEELSRLYRAALRGEAASLPDAPLQYADFALWQRHNMAALWAEQLRYWQQQLADLSGLDLPADDPPPPPDRSAFAGATHRFTLPAELTGQLRRLSARSGATLFMVLVAAFQTLLHRYTGQTDIPLGSPAANRRHPTVERIVGFFVNTVVLRTDLSGDPSFRELLARVREVVLAAHDHQELPFDRVVEALRPERAAGRQPLFRVMFSLQHAPLIEPLSLPGLACELWPVESGATQFDLSLDMVETAEGLAAAFEYNTALFAPETIGRLADQLERLLAGIAADPDQPLSVLPLLGPAERRLLLEGWAAPPLPSDYSRQSWIRLFEAQAERTPDAIALYQPEPSAVEITYRDLNQRANRLARYLQKRGIGPDKRVGLYLDRSAEMVIGLLGILKAGGAYLPLDPTYPRQRLAFMIEDGGIDLVVTDRSLAGSLPDRSLPGIRLDADWPRIAAESGGNLAGSIAPDQLAYVMYTSGSTGPPKGVMIEHRALSWYAQVAARLYGLTAADRVLQFSSISFDISVEEIYPCLLRGGRLVLRPVHLAASIVDFLAACRRWGITVLFLPTAFWHELATGLAEDLTRLPPSLRLVSFGGEKVLPERVAAWRRAAADRVELTNGYGPTETTVIATLCRLSDNASAASIGRTIPGARLYLLDGNREPVPTGTPGEIYIGGEGVARGYLNRPDLTAAHFLPNPFGPGRLYKTGDMARYRADGTIEYLGRSDRQVKVRGYRVELSEIEATLRQHPRISQAAAVVRRDEAGHKRLAAYIVADPPAAEIDWRAYLRQRLPPYMIPAYAVRLESLPLTPNGKVDRQALARLDPPAAESSPGRAGLRSPVERQLGEIWRQVLRVEEIDRHDNFFDLGGDSILSLQIIARANRAGLGLTPRQIFERQTIAELAEAVDTAPAVQAEQGLVGGPVPLTPIQRWFFGQELAVPDHWNMSLLLELAEPLDPARLEQALRAVVRHHDALRLRFERARPKFWESAGGIRGDSPRNFSFSGGVQKSGVSPSELTSDREWRQWHADFDPAESFLVVSSGEDEAAVIARLQSGLKLAEGPLFRAALFTEAEPPRLFLTAHHLVVDGLSWQILLEDLAAAYRQLGRGEAVRLPPKTTAYQTWANHMRNSATLPPARGEANPLPVDFPQGDNSEESARLVTVSLPLDGPAAHLQELLLAALVDSLAAWLDGDSILIDLEGHGREESGPGLDLSRTVGWFTAIFPVRFSLRGEQETLAMVRERLRERSRPRRAAPPQAEISFNYLGRFEPGDGSGLFRPAGPYLRQGVRAPHNRRSHLIEVDCYLIGGSRLHIEWTYSEHLHRRETIEKLAADFRRRLRARLNQSAGPDRYPLSPMQRTMLAYARRDPRHYVVQWGCILEGAPDVAAFRRAWQQAVDRHASLRTGFMDASAQIVRAGAGLAWVERDWRPLSPAERAEALAAFLRADRERGFALDRPPLMRLALLRLAEESHYFIWSHHHLVLDGWSTGPLWAEVARFYAALRQGKPLPALPAPAPYRAYIDQLDPATGPPRIDDPGPAAEHCERRLILPEAVTAGLTAFARQHRLTLNSLIQAAWLLLLGGYSREQTVKFWQVVSDRPASLEFESMIGLLVKSVPVEVELAPEQPLLAWLARLQQRQMELQQLPHSWPSDGSSLWERTLFRFQNYRGLEPSPEGMGGLRLRDPFWVDRWPYPLGLEVIPGAERLLLQLSYQTDRLDPATIEQVAERLERILSALSRAASRTVGDLLTDP